MTIQDAIEYATTEYRKGDVVREEQAGENVRVVHVYAMPHEDEAPDGLELVDVHFITVGVDKHKAEEVRETVLEFVDGYPRMEGGPSYIETGAVLGSQDLALRLIALGKVLGLWDVITPKVFGFEGAQADEMAGRGLVMSSGVNRGG